MDFYIADFDAVPSELAVKYEHEHPGFSRALWETGVETEPYWTWVWQCLRAQQEELGRDNPFTQHLGEL